MFECNKELDNESYGVNCCFNHFGIPSPRSIKESGNMDKKEFRIATDGKTTTGIVSPLEIEDHMILGFGISMQKLLGRTWIFRISRNKKGKFFIVLEGKDD
jgi:hypothetical protein